MLLVALMPSKHKIFNLVELCVQYTKLNNHSLGQSGWIFTRVDRILKCREDINSKRHSLKGHFELLSSFQLFHTADSCL